MPETKNDVVLTGVRPTGPLHLGHYFGLIKNQMELQGKYDSIYCMVADVQALTDNAGNPDKVRRNVEGVVLDNIACGVDPKKTTFFIQSQIPEIAELTVFFLNLVTLARLKRNPTVKDEIKQKGYDEDVPAGFLVYPVSQTADILVVKGNIVPVGEDQLPVLEQCNEIIQKFNSLYGNVFKKITPVVPQTGRLIGIDGNAKMSKSLNNAIYLADGDKEIEEKVMSMYTDPGHIHASDPGKVEGNVVFAYLDIFDKNTEELKRLKADYIQGGLGDVVIKKRLAKLIQDFISPIRARREKLAENPDYALNILKEGTEKVRKVAEQTMREVREAIKINYF